MTTEARTNYEALASLGTGSQARVLELVGENKRVLELGCATGYMSLAMMERGCAVCGVDNDRNALVTARAKGVDVHAFDIDDIEVDEIVWQTLLEPPFDVITAADVLEHLVHPERALRYLRGMLTTRGFPPGYLVASIPNVAHGSVRLALLAGTFPYSPAGLLDRTHLRFYTLDSIVELFDTAGWRIEAMWSIDRPIEHAEVPWPRDNPSFQRIAAQLAEDPAALTYQYVVKAVVA